MSCKRETGEETRKEIRDKRARVCACRINERRREEGKYCDKSAARLLLLRTRNCIVFLNDNYNAKEKRIVLPFGLYVVPFAISYKIYVRYYDTISPTSNSSVSFFPF